MLTLQSKTDELIGSIVEWIADTANLPAQEIGPETELLERQILDSLQLMDLVFHLEETQGHAIPLEWLTAENFASPQSIAAMVSKAKA